MAQMTRITKRKPGSGKAAAKHLAASKAERGKAAATRAAPRRRSAQAMLSELRRRLCEIDDLTAAAELLGWDQATYMPSGGARARGRQSATLHRLAHEQLVDPAIGRLLDGLQSHADSLSPDSDDACLIRVVRRDFEKAIKVPSDYVARANALGAASYMPGHARARRTTSQPCGRSWSK